MMENKNILAEQYKATEHEMDATPEQACKAVEEAAVETYKMIEKNVVEGYKAIEENVVEGYKKVENAFVEKFLTEHDAAEEHTVDNMTVEACKVVDRDTASDVAEAGELGAQTVVRTMSEAVVEAYKIIEEDVVGAYKKIEEGAVSAYKKVEDKFVEKLFAREGESVEDAKKRLQGK